VQTRLTAPDLASRTGSDTEGIRALVDAGILEPADDGTFPLTAINKVRLVTALLDGGITLEDMEQAVAAGKLSFYFMDSLFIHQVPLVDETFDQLVRESGLTREAVEELYVSWGLSVPGPEERVRADDAEALRAQRVFPDAGLDPETLVAATGFFGENLRRLAESQVSFFVANVMEPMLRAGRSPQDVLDEASPLSASLQPTAEVVVRWLHRRHFENYAMQEAVQLVERTMEEAGFAPPRPPAPPAIAFLDLSGYTRLTETSGDEAAAKLGGELNQLVRRAAQANDGRAVKLLGDGVMFYFADPVCAVRSGLQLVDMARETGLPEPRVGASAGPVVYRDGDYFGRTVNVAARITDYARPREVLVSAEVVAASDASDFEFQSIGAPLLKGLAEPVALYRALTKS
jgi:adenylate cyclase